MKNTLFLVLSLLTLSLTSCRDEDGDFNIFSIEDDKALGAQVDSQIEADQSQFPMLNETTYPTAYGHLRRITNTILNSGQVNYRNDFKWETHLIENDSVLNAFCTPGGYIYVYTGLIKFLESEDQLAGVMGHEIAHAAKRHSTDAMTRQYGIQTLLNIIFGQDKGAVARLAVQIKELQYGRKAETEADEFSVIYLYPTEYDARGASRFFEKLLESGQTGGTPTFLSTHPDPGDRVEKIQAKFEELGGVPGGTFVSRYQSFKNSLP
jgi:predicted Zn-dependent protease